MLLLHQKDLGLNAEDLNVLLNLLAHWYVPDRAPFPSAKTIANRMGVSERTVERSLSRLRQRGLIARKRVETRSRAGIKGHDLQPLVEKLEPFAREHLARRRMAVMAAHGQEA
jgi:DNA-binding GntR family transcriptional regulator